MSETEVVEEIHVDAWIDGVPLFIMYADRDEIMDDLKNHGAWAYMSDEAEEPTHFFPQIYYLMGQEDVVQTSKLTTGATTSVTTHVNGVYRVVRNLIGHAVTRVEDEEIGLGKLKQQAWFTLPKIPWSLIRDLDDFFRYVHQKHGTESVIIFTYDMAYENSDTPEDGWGFLVPDQTNSAASCDYEPESVVAELPDDKDIRLVGTAHSHPEMSAFCSGTDKRDQSQFDGIHITYGWDKGSTTTNFYIELQMGGGQFNFKPEQIFADMPSKEYDEKIKKLSEKVKKAPLVQGSYHGAFQGGTTGSTTYDSYFEAGGWWTAQKRSEKFPNLPDGCPEPDSNVTLVTAPLLTHDQLENCPACDKELNAREKQTLKCLRCSTFIRPMDVEDNDELIEVRSKAGVRTFELDFKTSTPYKQIWVWEEVFDEATKHIEEHVTKIFEGRGVPKDAKISTGADASKK